MQKRSVPLLIFFAVVTLGIYELVWLAKVRNEMVRKFGMTLPKTALLVIGEAFQLAAFMSVLLIVLVAIPAGNHKVDTVQRPSPQCFIEYAQSADSVRSGGPSTVSSACRQTVDNYYAAADESGRWIGLSLAGILAAFVAMGAVLILLLSRWLRPFAAAVEEVTGGTVSASAALILLVLAPPMVAMGVIQSAFNSLPSAPANN